MDIDDSIKLIDETANILDSDAFAALSQLHSALYVYKSEVEKALLTDSNFSINSASYIKNIKNQINTAITKASSYEMTRLIMKAESAIDAAQAPVPENLVAQIRSYIASIVKFIKSIEGYKFGGANNIQDMYNCILEVSTERQSLRSYKSGVEMLRTYITNSDIIPPGNTIIDLAFYSNGNSLQAFTQLAFMINSVYSEICQILGKAPESHALQIRMIHSGSVHLSLIGESASISLLETILKNSGKYFYETFTKSGEFQRLNGNMLELIEKLQLLTKLEENGVIVGETKAQLEKSLTLIAKAISENIKHQYRMTINNTDVQIYPIEAKTIPTFEPKLIPYRSIDETA